MKMSKILSLILVLVMVTACFVACGKEESNTPNAGSSTGTESSNAGSESNSGSENKTDASAQLAGTYDITMWVSELDGVAALFQTGAHAPGVVEFHVGIGDDGGLAFEPRTAAKVTDGFQRTVLNMHFVRFRPQGQGDIRHAFIITRHYQDASR